MTVTKVKSGFFGPSRGYFWPDYEDNRSAEMITERQKRQLTAYILSLHNNSDDEKQDKIEALGELTKIEAEDYLCEVSRWQ